MRPNGTRRTSSTSATSACRKQAARRSGGTPQPSPRGLRIYVLEDLVELSKPFLSSLSLTFGAFFIREVFRIGWDTCLLRGRRFGRRLGRRLRRRSNLAPGGDGPGTERRLGGDVHELGRHRQEPAGASSAALALRFHSGDDPKHEQVIARAADVAYREPCLAGDDAIARLEARRPIRVREVGEDPAEPESLFRRRQRKEGVTAVVTEIASLDEGPAAGLRIEAIRSGPLLPCSVPCNFERNTSPFLCRAPRCHSDLGPGAVRRLGEGPELSGARPIRAARNAGSLASWRCASAQRPVEPGRRCDRRLHRRARRSRGARASIRGHCRRRRARLVPSGDGHGRGRRPRRVGRGTSARRSA